MNKTFLAAIGIVLLTQCRPARMALQQEGWESKEEYAVAGKRGLFTRERLSFGDYYTTEVKRSWVKGSGSRFGLGTGVMINNDYTNLISVEQVKRNQTIRFKMSGPMNGLSEVYCVSKFQSSDLTVGPNPNSVFNIGLDIVEAIRNRPNDKYYVQVYTAAGQKPWEMMVDNVESQLKPASYTGYLIKDAEHYYKIVPVRHMEGKDGKPAKILMGLIGFEFRDKNDKPMAAVSLIDKGVVYLTKIREEERFLLANACAALLMREEIGQ